jgi:hypothetical protein
MCFFGMLDASAGEGRPEKIMLKQKAKAKWQSDPASSQYIFSGA